MLFDHTILSFASVVLTLPFAEHGWPFDAGIEAEDDHED
ncbi:hypothetical protein NAEX_04570 [Nannocystis exedens]|nr:hypothetical protein NAEX_04570 [Nannocystis exedens]